MTRDEMVKRSWRPYMTIDYQDEGMKHPAQCLLSAINFDAEILTLTPLNDFYEQEEFPANLKYCSIRKRLKIVAKDGKKVTDPTTNTIKSKQL